MESFVFGEMNKASRLKDESKIEFYDPLASALGLITSSFIGKIWMRPY